MKSPVRIGAVATTATILLLGSTVAATASGQRASTGIRLTHVAMVNASVGWGTTANGVVRTADGGRTWNTVLVVPKPAPQSTNGGYFVFACDGAGEAWAVTTSSSGANTYRTRNGGMNWKRFHQGYAGSRNTSVPGQLVFSDSQHGWLLLHDGAAAGSAPHSILRTRNGGKIWTRVEYNYLGGHPSRGSLPPCDGSVSYLSFRGGSNGWATGMCGAVTNVRGVFGTVDGGRSWHKVKVPSPVRQLQFFNPGQVIVAGPATLLMPVSVVKPDGFVLYRNDGGQGWHATTPIRASSGYPYTGPTVTYGPYSADISWVVIQGKRLYRTVDGGAQWSLMTSHMPAGAELDFVTPSEGFALAGMGSR